MMETCSQHDKLIEKVNEMHGDIKVLVTEFKAMNGTLRDTKLEFICHKQESISYRRQIDILWASVNTAKWAIGLLFGTGLLWKVIEFIAK
jgi:hypothetical protein